MALFVFAGAAQFMGAGLLASGAGVGEIALLTLLMNGRHAVYGLSVLDAYKDAGWRKPYLSCAFLLSLRRRLEPRGDSGVAR